MRIPIIYNHLRTVLKHSAITCAVIAGLGVGSVQAVTLTWVPAGGGVWNTTTANWTGGATTFVSNSTQDVIFDKTAGGTITIASGMSPLSTTVSAASGTYTFSGGPIATGSLTKSGNGTLVNNDWNTYSGGTIIEQGTLFVNWPGDANPKTSLGSGPITLNGGLLHLDRTLLANQLTVNGGSVFLDNGFGNTLTGPIILNVGLNVTAQYTNHPLSGDISGVGGITMTSSAGGGLILSGNNSYAGPTTVTGGTLQCNSPGALGSGNLSISSGGAKLNLNYTGTRNIGTLTLGGVLMTNPGTYGSLTSAAAYKSNYFEGNGLVSSGDSASAAFMTSFGTNVSGSNAVIDSVASNAANITWVLPSGTNLATLAPTFVLSPGATCSNRTSGAIPTPNFSAGPVTYNIVSPNTFVTNVYTVTATVLPAESTLIWNGGGSGAWNLATSNWLGQTSGLPTPFFSGVNVIFNQTAGGTITIASGMQPLSTTVSAASGTYTFSGGPIATGSLTKSGNGNLTISGNHTYSGGTIINGGQLTMDVQADTALGKRTGHPQCPGHPFSEPHQRDQPTDAQRRHHHRQQRLWRQLEWPGHPQLGTRRSTPSSTCPSEVPSAGLEASSKPAAAA